MNIEQLLLQSLQLLGLGMGSVFIILSLLIVIINVIAKFVPELKTAPSTPSAPIASTTNTQHIAVIQAAIHQYRRSRRTDS